MKVIIFNDVSKYEYMTKKYIVLNGNSYNCPLIPEPYC